MSFNLIAFSPEYRIARKKIYFFVFYDDEQKKLYKIHFTENNKIVRKEREPDRLLETYPFLE